MIPDRGTYAKALVFVLIMMKMMITPETFHPFKWRIPCMDSIMHSAIHKITKKKTGEEHKSILAHDKKHDAENCRGKNKTRHRWHKKTLFIAGIMMMIPVKYVSKLLHSRTFTYQVKQEAMCYVFKQRPEQHAAEKSKEYSCEAE